MGVTFVHVSDIHFGQERDHSVHTHDDVKQQLIADAGEVVSALPSGVAHGILVTGDIAQSGKWAEYERAGKWLDELAAEVGCPIEKVQMVPGNHDLDRDKLSKGGKYLLGVIRAGGPAEYEEVVGNDTDRATLFARFEDYGKFAIGYKCALDEEAKFATNLRIELAPGRAIRFIRLNSSLLCTGEEKPDNPELVMGDRQFTKIPRTAGEENIVLVHHPLNWYKDAEDAKHYIRTRSRVFISGHEHNPRVEIDTVDANIDVMMLAAGATVPFKSNAKYTYTYNIIEFDWDSESDALVVTMHPRAWNPEKTCFEADDERLGGKDPRFVLGSPNFRKSKTAKPVVAETPHTGTPTLEEVISPEPILEMVPAEPSQEESPEMPASADGADLALLRFFRDLYESERLRILVELDALSSESNERMTQGLERRLFDWVVREGKLPQLVALTAKLIAERNEGEA
jgi:hypothetical protein